MKQDAKKQKIVAVRLPLEMYEALSVIAEEDTRSMPNQIRQRVTLPSAANGNQRVSEF